MQLRDRLASNTRIFKQGLLQAGFSIPDGTTQIVPVITGSAEATMRFSEALLDEGIFAQGIRPPTVPPGTSRLRFTLMATHTPSDLTWAVERITDIGRRLGVL